MSAARKIMLVTGASGGIGAELARLGAEKGHDLALVARTATALEALADEIFARQAGARPRPLVFALDLAQSGAAQRLAAAVRDAGAEVEILVNNAGYGLFGPIAAELDDAGIAEQLGMIDLNIRALTELTLIFAPQLAKHRGKLLNVASIAAYMPGPGMAIYYASKAFVLSFSEALRSEWAGRGVGVTALCPGPVATGFQTRARFGAAMDDVLRVALSSRRVAELGYAGMMAGKGVVLPGLMARLIALGAPLTPKSVLLPLIASFQMKRS